MEELPIDVSFGGFCFLHYVVRILNIYSVSFGDIYLLHYVVTSLNIYFLDYDLLRIIID